MTQTLPTVETTVRVRYAETDAQGVVYHSNHLIFFEVGRGAFLREIGLDYNAMEASGVLIAVVEANVRYLAPAYYDDELTVVTKLEQLGSRSLSFLYELRKGPQLVASGRTAHVCLDRNGRPTLVPANFREAVDRHWAP